MPSLFWFTYASPSANVPCSIVTAACLPGFSIPLCCFNILIETDSVISPVGSQRLSWLEPGAVLCLIRTSVRNTKSSKWHNPTTAANPIHTHNKPWNTLNFFMHSAWLNRHQWSPGKYILIWLQHPKRKRGMLRSTITLTKYGIFHLRFEPENMEATNVPNKRGTILSSKYLSRKTLVSNRTNAPMATAKSVTALVKRTIWRILIERKRFSVRDGFEPSGSCWGAESPSTTGSAGADRSGEVSVGSDILIDGCEGLLAMEDSCDKVTDSEGVNVNRQLGNKNRRMPSSSEIVEYLRGK